MLLAQSLGEYGASGSVIARIATTFGVAAQWLEMSVRNDRAVWIAAACILVGVWFFRRR